MPRNPNQLYDTPEQKADLEARNGLLQFDEVRKLVSASRSEFKLTPDMLLRLQYAAIHDIYNCAGKFRTGSVYLLRSVPNENQHQPGPWERAAGLVDEMCSYVNGNFGKSAVHLSAYVMWRHNWIHPFFGGNGRTSRAVSYLVLCARLGYDLPGSPTVPQQIADVPKSRDRYFRALDSADAADKNGRLDVSMMEELVSDCLAAQLLSVHQQAGADAQPQSA
ncbi:MAG: Fic family protein [Candidatus Sulfotelmatobacter sp.]